MLCFGDTAILFPTDRIAQRVLRFKQATLPHEYGLQFVPPAEVESFLTDLAKQKAVGVCIAVEGQNAVVVGCDYI